MGKFSNTKLPSFLKKPNYFSDEETFDNETGRNPQVTEECETCDQAPTIAENKVLRFTDFLNEKKKINPGLQAYLDKKGGKSKSSGKAGKPDFLDLDGDGDKKESMKKAANDAKSGAPKKKTVAIKEGAMSELDLLAQEAKTFKSFVRAFKTDSRYKGLAKAGEAAEFEAWLKSIYDSAKENQAANESWDPRDAYEYGVSSDCCGAAVMMGDICSDCGEHCDTYSDDEEDDEIPNELGHNSNNFEYGIGKERVTLPNGRIMNNPGNSEYMAEGLGHSCHDGSKNMISEAAHHLIESICESTCSEAAMYEGDSDPNHTYEGYMNEATQYMEKRMYEMVDDGMTVNEEYTSESGCYESTCESIDAVCEKLCSEALELHNDDSTFEYNDYVNEALGCYRNGMMEAKDGGFGSHEMNESAEVLAKVTEWLADENNQTRSIKMSPEQQASEIGVTVEEYKMAIEEISKIA
jgi:hypothetical protein